MSFHIWEIEMLHVIAYEWKYFNIMNSSNFFLSELEEIKSWIYRVETANTGMGLSACGAAWGNWVDRESLLNTICDESLQSLFNAHPAFWVHQKKMTQGTDSWVAGYDRLFAGEKHYPF